MAIKPSDVYPAQVDVTSPSDYPQGKAQNITIADDGTGTPLEKTWVNDLWGFLQSLLREDGGAVPSGTPDTARASQYLDGVKAAALNADYTDPGGMVASVGDRLESQGFLATTAAEIQVAADYMAANFIHGEIHLAAGGVFVTTVTITVDVSYVSIIGHGAVIIASGIPSTGKAFNLIASTTPLLGQNPAVFKDFTVTGPGHTTTAAGFDLRNSTGGANAASGIVLENVNVKSFSYAHWIGAAVHPITFKNCGVYDCNRAFVSSSTGSKLELFGGVIADCDLVMNNSAGDSRVINMSGVLMQENLKLFTMSGGKLELNSCVMIAADYLVVPITLSGAGATIRMNGGELRLTDTAPSAFSRWVDAGAGTFFQAKGVRLQNTLTSEGYFGTGDGQIMLRETQIEDPDTECYTLHSSRSMLSDGGFENLNFFEDDIFFTETGVAIVDRHGPVGGTNDMVIETSGAQSRSGTRSLSIRKSGGGGNSCRFALACIPVRAFDRVGGGFYFRKPTTSIGVMEFNYSFVKLGVNEFGVPTVLNQEINVKSPLTTFTAADTNWVERRIQDDLGSVLVAPEWATHFIVEFIGNDWIALGEYIYFDDLNVNIIG